MSNNYTQNGGAPDSGYFDRKRCPICDANPVSMISAPEPWLLAWCGDCKFAFITNPPRYEAVAGEFEWEASIEAERERRHVAHGKLAGSLAAVLKRQYRKLTKRDKLLSLSTAFNLHGEVIDVGCGDGHLWGSLPAGCAPVGIELSPALARKARARLQGRPGRMIEADALAGLRQLGESSADGAILISYLEHEANPAVTLGELRRVLRPGAVAILKVPNFACWSRTIRSLKWCGYRFPDHVNYFTPVALRRIAERCGFEIVRFGFGDHPPTSDNMWCVARVPR